MRIRALFIAIAASLLITTTAVAAVPTATTGNATGVTQTTVKLNGTVKPNSQDTNWHFEYGTTNAYGTTTPEAGPVASGAGSTNVSADVAGLAPGTVYHYRLVATNASGAIPGKDRTFTTRSAVSLNSSKTTANFNESVTLAGQVFGTAVAGITVTLQENPYPFAGWTDIATTTTDAAGRYQFIRAVRANTAWRVVAGTKPPGTSNTAFVLEADLVGLKASTSRPRRGRSVLFTGFSLPARVGSPVYIQRLGRGGWHTVLTAKLSVTPVPDTASYAVRLKKVVSGVYRAYVPGGYDHVAGASSAKRITVRR
ncbi:MAG: hypothetical protein QOH13_2569 [Thermoleophilaceae bacterium]|jgi:hypothetical protein|nr:hypothetical protein [Thermoleophilaceae bacterium]